MAATKATRLAAAIALLVLAPVAGDAQPSRTVVIGVLGGGSRSANAVNMDALRQALQERGYVDGRNVRFEERWTEARLDRLPELAAELVRLRVDVIVAGGGTPSALAAKRATRDIPIVFSTAGDPVGNKLVESLARPGGNVTGLSVMAQELGPKRLELLRQTLPGVTRMALLTNLGNPALVTEKKEMESAATLLKLDLRVFDVRRSDDVDEAIADVAKQRVGAVIIAASPIFNSLQPRLFALTLKYRLPAMASAILARESDFFMAVGFDVLEHYRHAAIYVDKILKGAKPADLPVEQPTKFRLVVNLKTAKALGVTIPPTVLLQADKIIQ